MGFAALQKSRVDPESGHLRGRVPPIAVHLLGSTQVCIYLEILHL